MDFPIVTHNGNAKCVNKLHNIFFANNYQIHKSSTYRLYMQNKVLLLNKRNKLQNTVKQYNKHNYISFIISYPLN